MSELDSIIEADDLEELKRQVAYTFLDAYGNSDGADILFDAIVTATEKRIIKLLETYVGLTGMFALERDDLIALIKGENK